MRHTRKRKRKTGSIGIILVKVFILTLFISSIVSAAVGEATVVRSENESILLAQEINQLNYHNEKLRTENKNLEIEIKNNETSYQQTESKAKIAHIKIAYLTFDDGPSTNTEAILKILKENDVKATFFVNGHPELSQQYKEISDDGHTLANHTYSHIYKNIYTSANNFKTDVEKLDEFITSITGKQPSHILRYPGGSNNTLAAKYGGSSVMNDILKEMNASGYKYFDWNVDSSDASAYRQNKDTIVQAVLDQSSHLTHPIVLMHDLEPKTTTVQALPEIIIGLKKQGFVFDVLSKDIYAPQFTVAK